MFFLPSRKSTRPFFALPLRTLSARDLGISDSQLNALKQTYYGLKHRTLPGKLGLGEWYTEYDCGTVACIAGWADYFNTNETDATFCSYPGQAPGLYSLFMPIVPCLYAKVTRQEAAAALKGWLTTGKTDWSHVPVRPY